MGRRTTVIPDIKQKRFLLKADYVFDESGYVSVFQKNNYSDRKIRQDTETVFLQTS